MMAPTHVFVSLLLASPLLLIAPEASIFVFAFAVIGGFLPDFDLFFGTHRKTLHFPSGYFVGSLVFILIAFVYTTVGTISLAALAIGVCSHVFGDILGAGLEYKPWEKTSDRGVYNHIEDEWIAPTYILGHDGSLRDFTALLFMSPLVFFVYSDVSFIVEFIVGIVLLALLYSALRKILPSIEEYLYKNSEISRKLLDMFLYDSESDRPWKAE